MRYARAVSCLDPLILRTAVAGDSGDGRTIELTGIDAVTGADVTAQVWRDDGPAAPLAVTVVDEGTLGDASDPPVVRIVLGSWLETDAVGGVTYYVEVKVAIPGVGTWTFPSACPARLHVRRPGVPA